MSRDPISFYLCEAPEEFEAWDDFVLSTPGAHYGQMYGWLSSYEAMGFDCEVLVQSEGDRIVGGAAFVSVKLPLLGGRIFVLPHGPVGAAPHDPSWAALMTVLEAHFRQRGAVYVQVWPHVPYDDQWTLKRFAEAGYQDPPLFKSHNFSSTLLAVDLADRTEEDILNGFRRQTRYSCRKSMRSGFELRRGVSLDDLARSYELLVENGREQGYRPRPYASLAIAFERLIQKGRGLLLQAWKDGTLAGTLVVLFAGRIATYYAGATRREFSAYRPGEFLQWSAMRLARQHGMAVYDLMNWTSERVADFKRGFRPRECRWAEPRTRVFKPHRARAVSWAEAHLRPLVRRVAFNRAGRRLAS